MIFHSTTALESRLDGSDQSFARYFFALYHCSPDEQAGINELREQLRLKHPTKCVSVGQRFVLTGKAAYQALAAYYRALSEAETLGDDFRGYAAERLAAITKAHRDSQALPVPIDLTEGQLAQDFRLELLTCVAIHNGQVSPDGS
jgi:hypothetical protein